MGFCHVETTIKPKTAGRWRLVRNGPQKGCGKWQKVDSSDPSSIGQHRYCRNYPRGPVGAKTVEDTKGLGVCVEPQERAGSPGSASTLKLLKATKVQVLQDWPEQPPGSPKP